MNKPFIEDFDDTRHADPLDTRTENFDWDELERRLGEAKATLPESDHALLATALSEILRWLVHVDIDRKGFEHIIARRVLSLLWTISPAYFEGSPSLTQIAERINTQKATMSRYASEASRKFKVRNRGQAHGWNFNRDA